MLYGSLMRGLGAIEELGLSERVRYVGPCICPGELYDLGDYPGLRHGGAQVVGELFALLEDGVLEALDEFEGYAPNAPRESLYLRERIQLIEPRDTEAWTYVYNHVPDASSRIPSGDWRAHLATREAS